MKNLTQQLVKLAQECKLHILLKEVGCEIRKENDPAGNQIAIILWDASYKIQEIAETTIEVDNKNMFFGINSEVID